MVVIGITAILRCKQILRWQGAFDVRCTERSQEGTGWLSKSVYFSSFLQDCSAIDGCLIGGVCKPVCAGIDKKGVRIRDVHAVLCEKFIGAQVSKAVVCCDFC